MHLYDVVCRVRVNPVDQLLIVDSVMEESTFFVFPTLISFFFPSHYCSSALFCLGLFQVLAEAATLQDCVYSIYLKTVLHFPPGTERVVSAAEQLNDL